MFEKFMEKFSKDKAEDEMEFKTTTEIEAEEAPEAPREAVEEKEAPRADAGSVELKVIRPEAYDEVSNVADSLLAGCTVVLNLEALERPVMIRMLDFLNGVTYCTGGEIKKVAPATFIITPHDNIDISDM